MPLYKPLLNKGLYDITSLKTFFTNLLTLANCEGNNVGEVRVIMYKPTKKGAKRKPIKPFIPEGRLLYEVYLRTPSGDRWRKSLGVSDETLAQAMSEQLQKFMNTPESKADYILHHINSVLIKIGESPVKLSFVGANQGKLFHEALDLFMDSKSSVSKRSLEAYNTQKKCLSEIMGEDLKKDISQITNIDAQKILNEYAKGKGGSGSHKARSEGSCKNFKKFCSSLYVFSHKQEWTTKNPFLGVVIKPTEKMVRIPFSDDEVERLCAVSDPEWRLLNILASCTGMRIGDASRCGASYFKRIEGRLMLSWIPEKSRGFNHVTIPVVEPLLSEIENRTDEEFLFPTLCKLKVGGNAGLDYRFLKVMKEAEVSYEIKKTPAGRDWRTKHYHSWRHTLNTRLAKKGVPQDIRRAICGHASDNVNDIYSHHATEDALNKINEKL